MLPFCLTRTNILDFINGLSEGYDTVVGEKGVKLSGGQKQRLSIARVILLNPDIIIFDESTSSLDYHNEKEILKSIEILSKDKMVISIAHRLSTIVDANLIIVMDKGEIINCGTHAELRGKSEIYDILFQKQSI